MAHYKYKGTDKEKNILKIDNSKIFDDVEIDKINTLDDAKEHMRNLTKVIQILWQERGK